MEILSVHETVLKSPSSRCLFHCCFERRS